MPLAEVQRGEDHRRAVVSGPPRRDEAVHREPGKDGHAMIDRARGEVSIHSRRVLLRGVARLGLIATGTVTGGPQHVLAQETTPVGMAEVPGFRLAARVLAEEWGTLTTATATPEAGEELAGAALQAALREGGFVIYFRHARTDFSQDDTDLGDLENCATQRNLSAEGREQARLIGEAIAALNFPIGEILSSELCRTRETAELAFGRVTLLPDLTSFGTAGSEAEEEARVEALRRLLATPPAPGTNTVLVGHLFNIQGAAGIGLAEGEAAIFAPSGTVEAPATPAP